MGCDPMVEAGESNGATSPVHETEYLGASSIHRILFQCVLRNGVLRELLEPLEIFFGY